MRVLGKRAQAHRLRRVARANDADRLRADALAQDLAAREQRVEDRFSELRAPTQQSAELLLGDDEDAAGLRDTAAERAALPGQQVQLADEAAAAVGHDHDGIGAIAVYHLDVALEDHEEVVGGLTRGEQHFA